MNRNSRRRSGFTLVEMMVTVVIIGILTALTVPNYVSAQDKSRTAQMRSNMHTIQLASESYCIDTHGRYATSVAQLAPYLPGGSCAQGGMDGSWPGNPYPSSGHQNQPDPAHDGSSITDVDAARNMPAGSFTDASGCITYDHALAPNSYAIWGCDAQGKSLSGVSGKQLILSND